MDKIKKYLRKLIMVFFLIYGYNNLTLPINMHIPINLYTIIIVYIFGLPSLLALIIIKLIFFY